MSAIFFPSSNIGYAVGGQSILKTTNAGSTWTVLTSAAGASLTSLYFNDVETGYVVGGSGAILKTIDGGVTWTKQWSKTINNLNSVCFPTANIGYVAGDAATILNTTDGGGYPVGLTENTKKTNSLKIYPNPSSNFVTVEISAENDLCPVSVFDLNGSEIISRNICGYKSQIDISNLPAGVYFLKCIDKNGVQVGKIIKQ
jgi:photosystem II stability/assembly factor-like uncharacterized protein